MPRQIPLLLCLAFCSYLLWRDAKRNPLPIGLWVVVVWFAILASRAVSTWFGMGVAEGSPDYYLEGSPFDRNVSIALILFGAIILWKRRVDWAGILRNNKAVFIYILYLGFSALWSDYAFVSFKRWIKELGNIIMVMVVLSEVAPMESLKTVIIRTAYVLIPLSIILNRYFPDLSRLYSKGGGNPMFSGVATNKNALGALCVVCGITIFWSFFKVWSERRQRNDNSEIVINFVLLIMIAFLLYGARSATSWLATIMGCTVIVILNTRYMKHNPHLIWHYAIAALCALVIIQLTFGLTSITASGLGRDETLTGRTDFWRELLAVGTNPLIGTGYESFWMGDRIAFFWDKYWWHPNQAHNGYLEVYLNLGLIGLFLLLCIVLRVFRNVARNMSAPAKYDYQVFRIAFLLVIIAINFTEANFKGLMWLVFLFISMEFLPDEDMVVSGQHQVPQRADAPVR